MEDTTNHQPEDLADFEGNPPQHSAIDLLEKGFFMLDEDLGSDSEDETEDEEHEDESIDKPVTDEDIVTFTQILAEAQFAAVKTEHIATAEKPNRKCHYTGNSKRTKRYHAPSQKQWKLGETVQRFIQSFFENKPAVDSISSSPVVDSESGKVEFEVLELEEDVDDEIAVEIVADSGEEHPQRLLPEDNEIQVSISRHFDKFVT